jgi:hypothetical protein
MQPGQHANTQTAHSKLTAARMLHAGSDDTCSNQVLPWGMCGGVSAACATDGTCSSWCCTPGYTCSKITSYYWQCQPVNTTEQFMSTVSTMPGGVVTLSRAAAVAGEQPDMT